jgi:glycoside/pentoside/hexuronide:cation symporter, GPH family
LSHTASGGASRLPTRTKVAFGLGSGAESVTLYAISQFAVLYYFQVRGLSPGLAGLAVSVSLVLDAISDPFAGSLSDRTRSKWGRRHPYMFASPVFIVAAFVAIFNPPGGLSDMGLFFWFLASVVVMRQAMTFYHTPHLALGGELSSDYVERSKVMAWASFLGWAGGAATFWVATRLFFPETPEYSNGLLNPEPWLPYSLTMGVVALLFLYGSAWFTRDRIPFLPQPPENQAPWSPLEFFKDIGRAMGNINYVWIIVGYFFLSMMVGLRNGLHIFTNTFFWELKTIDLSWFVIGSFFGFLTSFVVAPRVHGRFDKKMTMIVAGLAYAVVPAVPMILGLMGVLTSDTPGLVPILIAFHGAGWCAISILSISIMSALADISDENELKHGIRQEGVLYATRAFFAKVDAAIGTAFAGLVLGFISFPETAKPGQVAPEVLQNLVIWDALVAMIPGVLAVFFYTRYRITRSSYDATRAALNAKRSPTPSPTVTGVLAAEDIGSPLEDPGGGKPAPGRA